MNSMSIGIILIILVIVIILLVVVISMITKTTNKKTTKKNEEENISLPSNIGLFLPSSIENIGPRELQGIVKKIFDSYKYFDYYKMSLNELEKKEWHSWQFSLVLMLFKHNEEFFIADKEELFHPFLVNASENDIKSLMNGIIRKYKNYVEINKGKDFLSKDYIWTCRDISILFYFLASYKDYSK